MKYTEQQDINAIVSSMLTGKPKEKTLIKRLTKKYSWKGIPLLFKAFAIFDHEVKLKETGPGPTLSCFSCHYKGFSSSDPRMEQFYCLKLDKDIAYINQNPKPLKH